MKEEGPEWYTSHRLPSWELRDVVQYPWLAGKAYFVRVKRVFGVRMLAYVALVQLLLKGSANAVAWATVLPLFKNVLHVEATSLQLYSMVIAVPWAVKPLLGMASDYTVIGGFHKRPWLFGGLLCGLTCGASLYAAYYNRSAGGLAVCFAGVQMQIALFDLMTEASFSTVMRLHPYTGADVVTLMQGCHLTGSLLVTSFVGPLSDAGAFRALFAITLALCLVPLPMTVFNWLGEERVSHECARLVERREERGQALVIGGAGVGAVLVAVLANTADPVWAAVMALLVAASCVLGAYAVFPRTVAALALYQVLTTLSRPGLVSALEYFYTADARCLPGGPHFSFAYLQTVVGIVSALCGLLGVVLYQWWLGGMRYRRVIWITTTLRAAMSFSDLWIVKRWNVALGVSDKAAYLLGEAMLEPVFVMLNYILGTVLVAKSVRPGMESSIYAFMAGVYNFAAVTARLVGALLYEAAGVRTVVEPGEAHCHFAPLGWLIVVCYMLLPLAVGLPAAYLVPDIHQDQPLEDEDEPPRELPAMWLEPDSDTEGF